MSSEEKEEVKKDEAKEEEPKKEDAEAKPDDAKKDDAPAEEAKKDDATKDDAPAADAANGESPADLTKRLQKLALERQKENKQDRLKVVQSDKSSHLAAVKSFQELNLPKHLLDAVFAMGFDRPSVIQEEALPRILADPPRNLIGQAQSGSGKTAAFTLGMLYRTKVDAPASTQAICCTPTRELAIQIFEKALKPMASNMEGLKVSLAVAGTNIERGKKLDAHIVIGTPGKIVDWLKRKAIVTKNIKVLVLDEADSMIEESGHRANSLLIKKQMPKKCQSLLFSATFPPEVVTFATKMVDNPDKILIEDGDEFLVVDVIKQIWIDTRDYEGGKLQFLSDIYEMLTIGQSIVFVGTKRDADNVHRTLSKSGYDCSVLHGGVSPEDRDSTMQNFRDGKSTVLITTNVLARGVDVDNVMMVVNYDVPVDRDGNPDYETYLHRIGRTGRFGRKGTAISLIHDQRSLQVLASIEQHFTSQGKEMIEQAEADPETLADKIEI
ncbi:dependent RNA helicase [Seminavis robusta]|uniref:RNA helicase n=1 Tax=Seminavis robusta TaxID=568900 RepID=A0A9N8HLY8_9STRA|nr:dependent RNA helicase [Seminavis robusta]|eukprot:Sro864_g212650.1 dependent RNA helicase (496) ;mRNA; f:26477-28064